MAYRFVMITLMMWLAGCQTKPQVAARPQTLNAETEYEAAPASALVFDPPVIQDEPRLELSRAERQPSVVMGYEEITAEYFSIRLDDRQISNGGVWGGSFRGFGGGSYDRYERRAVTNRVGVRYR